MAFKKTARKSYKCGECTLFDKEKNVCKHHQMNGKKVDPASFAECGGAFFFPEDDFENN